jgi:RNA polymerase sigma-70 factor (ECF subfamily)
MKGRTNLEFALSAGYLARARSATLESPHRADPDEDVLDLVHKGELTEALQHLMRRHGRTVYRYCRVALNDAVFAEDVHQQVFYEAFRDLPSFAGRSSLRTWLLGIARHRVLDAANRRQRTESHASVDMTADLPDPRPSPGEALDDARLVAALATCVAELDEPIRTAILLRYQLGLTYEEMAQICDEHPGTLQARVTRAVRQLRDRIAETERSPKHRARPEASDQRSEGSAEFNVRGDRMKYGLLAKAERSPEHRTRNGR